MYRMVFTQVFYRLKAVGVLLSICLFASCGSYRTFQVEVLKNAEVPVKSGKRIGFLDRNICYSSDTSSFLFKINGAKRRDLSYLFYLGVNDGVKEQLKVDTVLSIVSDKPTYLHNNEFVSPMAQTEVKLICDGLGIDYIISLENCYYNSSEGMGLSINYCIRLYSADGSLNDSLNFCEDISDLLGDEYGIADIRDIVTQYAINFGWSYAQRLSPQWEQVERRIYIRGRAMRVGDAAFQNDRIEEALQIWEFVGKNSSKQAVMVAINKAWIYENTGDFEQALEVLQNAKEKATSKTKSADLHYLDSYISILQDRIVTQQKLLLLLSE